MKGKGMPTGHWIITGPIAGYPVTRYLIPTFHRPGLVSRSIGWILFRDRWREN